MAGSSVPSRLPPGTQFARYRIVREVGSGGMGAVYEAILVDLNKRVALKVLSRELSHRGEHRERFMREGRAAARIRHPNVVEIFDVGEHEGQPFLAMEFLVGTDLRARFDKGPLSPADLLDVALPVLAAVVTAHDAQVIHRDLKPENIFLNEHPGHGVQPMVLDFGISKVLDDLSGEKLTATSTMIGTPLYMSPEQVRKSREVDPRTDQYALGVMLYEGLTGVCAFTSDSLYDLLLKKVEGEFAPLRTLRPELPEELCTVIERAMSADRERRFSNVRAFANALLPFARERTRAVWGAIFSVKTGDEMSPEAIEAAAAIRADSTLRSSVRDLPAVTARSSGARRVAVPALILLLGAAGALAIVFARQPADAPSMAPPSMAAPAAASVVAEPPRPAPPELFTVHVVAEQPAARIALDGEAVTGTLTRQLPKDGKPHVLEISAEGFETKRVTFVDAPPDPSALKLVAVPAPPAPAPEPAQSSAAERRSRKDSATPRKKPSAPSEAQPEAPPAPRRKVGSNDAPVLY